MFDKIDNIEHVYIYSGNKIYKSRVIKFHKIDSETIFVKAENEGNLIFEKSYKFKKGDKIYALNENCFENENISLLVKELKDYNNRINKNKLDIEKHKIEIAKHNLKIEWCERMVKNLSVLVIETKQQIAQEKKNEKVIS